MKRCPCAGCARRKDGEVYEDGTPVPAPAVVEADYLAWPVVSRYDVKVGDQVFLVAMDIGPTVDGDPRPKSLFCGMGGYKLHPPDGTPATVVSINHPGDPTYRCEVCGAESTALHDREVRLRQRALAPVVTMTYGVPLLTIPPFIPPVPFRLPGFPPVPPPGTNP